MGEAGLWMVRRSGVEQRLKEEDEDLRDGVDGV